MHVVTAEIMQELDRRTIQEVGIPGAVLMEKAGQAAANILMERFPDLHRRPVILVCGAGDSGGDGFVIARHLHERQLKKHTSRTVEKILSSAQKRQTVSNHPGFEKRHRMATTSSSYETTRFRL